MHICYFLFAVGGFVSILIGAVKRWSWIRNAWFRIGHLAAVYIVILENVFRIQCPLNTLESNLRSTSASVEPASATGGFLDYLLFHTIPGRLLDVMYWSLGVVLVIRLFAIQPRFKARDRIF